MLKRFDSFATKNTICMNCSSAAKISIDVSYDQAGNMHYDLFTYSCLVCGEVEVTAVNNHPELLKSKH